MLSVGHMSGAGQGSYYLELAQEDYYLAGGEPPGIWYGEGASVLGLEGEVEAQAFKNLLQGYHPEREQALVRNAGKENRQSGWDLTFSAPKSVSVVWSQADVATRTAIETAHEQAVRSALSYLEREAGVTRRGAGGLEKEPASMTFAVFQHGTSRAQEPSLHSHALALNVGIRQDLSTGTIESRGLYRHKMAAGALYRAELSSQLEHVLGLETVRHRTWFEVKGVPQSLVSEFSTRRNEVQAQLEEKGYSSAKASEIATFETRTKKENVAREALFSRWKEVGNAHGFSQEQVQKLLHTRANQRNLAHEKEQAFSLSVEKLLAHQSHFTKKDVIRGVAEQAQGRGFGAAAVEETVSQRLLYSEKIVSLGRVEGEMRYSTKEMLALEERMLRVADSLSQSSFTPVSEAVLTQSLALRSTMSAEQVGALRHITQKDSRIGLVTGMAGTGKSFMLGAAKDAWEQSGHKVIGACLSGKAAQGLQEGAGISSDTIHKVLYDIEVGRSPLRAGTVLVVDEAGMVGSQQMAQLLEETKRVGAKIVLVGDARQLQPVTAGGPFKALVTQIGDVSLRDIRRQKEAWAREVVHHFADGRAQEGLTAFAQKGLLQVSDTRDGAMRALLSDWQSQGKEKPSEHLILAGTNSEAATLNKRAQLLRFQAGELKGQSVAVGGSRFFVGDRILFNRNSRMHRVRNGHLGTVQDVDAKRGELVVTLDSSSTVRFSVKEYDHIRLGYAVTTHKAQGMTAQNSYILAGGPMQDRELSYVQVSRAQGETKLYTDQLSAGDKLRDLAHQMNKSRQKELAASLLKEKQPEMEQGYEQRITRSIGISR